MTRIGIAIQRTYLNSVDKYWNTYCIGMSRNKKIKGETSGTAIRANGPTEIVGRNGITKNARVDIFANVQ